jgi:Ca2+-binding RTX toxin-like protein
LTLTANITEIENISILGGGNTGFGEPGTNRHDYVLTTHDANFAAGVQARINASALLAEEDFTFDGIAETDASFVVYGGRGKDTLRAARATTSSSSPRGGSPTATPSTAAPGYDGMFLRGNYTIDFTARAIPASSPASSKPDPELGHGRALCRGGGTEFDYNLVPVGRDRRGGAAADGQRHRPDGERVDDPRRQPGDGRQPAPVRRQGLDVLKGGALNDLFHGNLGADTLAGRRRGGLVPLPVDGRVERRAMDHILDFTPGTDRIELDRIDADTLLAGNQAFSWIGSSGVQRARRGELRAYETTARGSSRRHERRRDGRPRHRPDSAGGQRRSRRRLRPLVSSSA